MAARHFSIDLRGEFALAGYFVMANWPNPKTAPIVTSDGSLKLIFEPNNGALSDLRSVLQSARAKPGGLAPSAEALWRHLGALEGG